MNRNALSFIEASEKLFGANAIVTRDNINEIVKESGAPYPYWLVTKTEYRYGRGQYKVPSSGNKVEHIEQKDINDMILHGNMSPEEIVNTINTNTFKGIEAKLRFSTWRKV